MSLTLRVTYPATDGSMPESVELEWADPPAAPELLPVLGALLGAPAERHLSMAVRETPCRRIACGHARSGHSRLDDTGKDVGYGNGACAVCGNPNQCRSYVGSILKETT